MLAARSALRPGRHFHPGTGTVVGDPAWEPGRAWDLWGRPLEPDGARGPLRPVGDPWGMITCLALGHGLDPAVDLSARFDDARASMMHRGYDPGSVPALAQGIRSLGRRIPQWLVSNAASDHVRSIVAKLRLEGAFARILPSAGKPAGFRAVEAELCRSGLRLAGALAVGDKVRLDLDPVRRRGGRTWLINPWTVQNPPVTGHFRSHLALAQTLTALVKEVGT